MNWYKKHQDALETAGQLFLLAFFLVWMGSLAYYIGGPCLRLYSTISLITMRLFTDSPIETFSILSLGLPYSPDAGILTNMCAYAASTTIAIFMSLFVWLFVGDAPSLCGGVDIGKGFR